MKSGDQPRNAPVPLRIGQAQLAVDDRERVRIPRNAGKKTNAEIEHATQPARDVYRAGHDRPLARADKPRVRQALVVTRGSGTTLPGNRPLSGAGAPAACSSDVDWDPAQPPAGRDARWHGRVPA